MSATIPTQAKEGLESGTFQLPPCTSGVDFCATRVHGRRILSEAFGAFDGEKYGPLAQPQSRCFGHAGSHASKRRLAGYFGAQPHSGKIRGRCGVFVICYRVSKEQAEELTRLFRRNCPEGRVIFVTDAGHKDEVPRGTDLAVPESNCGELVLQAVKEDDKPQGSRNAA
ncbi:MAG: hypothetical protein DMG99_15305 [Acidobacteria bacterium]|nr:MAG: hypothetical protein DMG99_15305 [Acidobacteriota bacterium]